MKLIFCIVLVEALGAIGAYFTTPAIPTWYASLIKPNFNPPNYLFAPVWTLLYFLMGISLYLIWESKNKGKKLALKLFWLQFTANIVWSVFFFGLKNPLLGLIDIIVLILLLVYLIKSVLFINKTAAYLLLPYLAWVSFATILNLSIVLLN